MRSSWRQLRLRFGDGLRAQNAQNSCAQLPPRSSELPNRSSNARIENAIFGIDPRTPLSLFEARNAVRIARNAGADKYAASALANADKSLSNAETAYRNKQKSQVATFARDAAQTAEDARVMSLKKQEEERLSQEATQREALAKQR